MLNYNPYTRTLLSLNPDWRVKSNTQDQQVSDSIMSRLPVDNHEVQYTCILCSYFSFENVCLGLVLNCVIFSVTKIPSSFCLSCLLFEYTWFLTRYDSNLTITCDFPTVISALRSMTHYDEYSV
jgi:hypothetical protein